MASKDAEGGKAGRADDDALGELLLAPAAILEGLPDAVVAAASDGRIVYVNELAEALFGYPRVELIGRDVHMLWPERIRERYTRNMELYFATEHPLRFSTEVWGLRRDGTEFVGEMSWGIVETAAGKLLLAIGRDVSERRAAETRLRAVAAMGERALAGADPADLAGEAVELLRVTLPIERAAVIMGNGETLADDGPDDRIDVRLPIGAGAEVVLALEGELGDEEMSFVRAVANTLGTALARLRSEERMRHEAVHDPLTGLANRTLLRDRLEHALARSQREEERSTGSCSWTSTTSSRSTTPTATPPATSCWWSSAAGCARRCGRPTPWPGSAATSSSSCARRSTPRTYSRSASACWPRSASRSRSRASSTS